MNRGKKAVNYNPNLHGEKNKFSNRLMIKGKWSSPKNYVCKDCGIRLNKNNTYKNAFLHKQYRCKNCERIKIKLFYRNHKLNGVEGRFLLREKLPHHPRNNKCMLCFRFPYRSKGLCFHHWYIDRKRWIAYGVWLCCVCHMFVERYENGFLKKYLKLKKQLKRKYKYMKE